MLTIKNLTLAHKNTSSNSPNLLTRLNANLQAGKISALVAADDAERAALLSILSGFAQPTEGSVIAGDGTMAGRVALLFSGFNLFSKLTALENVSFPMEQSGIAKADARRKASELLESMGIESHIHSSRPRRLTQDHQSRIAIARVLATGSRIILANDPTALLDEEDERVTISILRHLAHSQGY